MFKKTLVLALLVICTMASAQTQWCSGKVSALFVSSDGGLLFNAEFRGSYIQVCNVNAEWKGVSQATCLNWAALLRSAVSRKANTVIYYPNLSACTSIETYGAAVAPGYVMLVD